MLDQLHLEDFQHCVGTPFRLHPDQEWETRLELKEVTNHLAGLEEAVGEAFSLLFMGPSDVVIPQGMHPLEHETLGVFDLFLVPVGMGPEGRSYEAVFNRQRR